MLEVVYREATAQDAAAIAALSLEIQERYAFSHYSQAGQARMRRLSSASATARGIAQGDRYFLAEHQAQLVGAIGVRDHSHILQLFVATRWHRRGIGTELWALVQSACREAGADGSFTLNASSFALGVYQKWGFQKTGDAQDRDGVTTTPMRYVPGSPS